MKRKYAILFSLIMMMTALCGCGKSSDVEVIVDEDIASLLNEDSTVESSDRIYEYDFTGYYFKTSSIDDDEANSQDEEYNNAVNLYNGNYDSTSTYLDFDFQIINECAADTKSGERVSVEIDRENYTMRLIDNWGEIEYYEIVYCPETNGYMFLRTFENGGSPWYYATKARDGY